MSTSMTGTVGKSGFRPVLWTPGDWNALFGFGTNILVNMLVLTGLLRFVLKMPDSLVFGRILPAAGLMMCLSTAYYAWLAYRLAKKTGRKVSTPGDTEVGMDETSEVIPATCVASRLEPAFVLSVTEAVVGC